MEKISVGILTLPLSNNYGGILQAAALYEFLNVSGFNPILIRRQHTTKKKDILKQIFAKNPFWRIADPANTAKRYRQDRYFRKFINNYFLNKTEKCFSSSDLAYHTKDIDSFIVGSDQVWRFAYTGRAYRDYFLEFVDNRPKIAYAASFGLDRWEDGDSEADVSILLKRFSAVSVREIQAIEYLKTSLGVDSISTLDPTFLVDKKFYYEIMGMTKPQEPNNVFNYVLDQAPEKQRLVNDVCKILGLGVNTIDLNPKSWETKASISTWLRKIFNAKFVVTDSFHGMVFSIIFNKPFLAIANKDRGYARFQSLTSELGLDDRLITGLTRIDNVDLTERIQSAIDYGAVNKRIEILKTLSSSFILDNLNKYN